MPAKFTNAIGRNMKAIGAGFGAAVATVLIWGLEAGFSFEFPGEVEAAITVIVTAAVTWIAPANSIPNA